MAYRTACNWKHGKIQWASWKSSTGSFWMLRWFPYWNTKPKAWYHIIHKPTQLSKYKSTGNLWCRQKKCTSLWDGQVQPMTQGYGVWTHSPLHKDLERDQGHQIMPAGSFLLNSYAVTLHMNWEHSIWHRIKQVLHFADQKKFTRKSILECVSL